jgi:hypothetical protein
MKSSNSTKIGYSVWVLASLMFIGILGLASASLAAEDTWTTKADMPTARGYLATAVVNGKAYAIGGAKGPTSGSLAEDTQSGLATCASGLYIGCDNDMTPGTFFSGLIDDVRIYNRAVKP